MKLLVLILGVLLVGCQSGLSPAEQKTLQSQRDQLATQLQQLKNQQTVALQKQAGEESQKIDAAKASPTSHPWAANDQTVKELHPILLALTIVFFVVCILAFGYSFTPWPLAAIIGKLVPMFRWGAVLSLIALLCLPYVNIALIVGGAAFIALTLWEIIKDKGNIRQAVEDIQIALGIKPTPTVTPATPPTTVAAVAVANSDPEIPGAIAIDNTTSNATLTTHSLKMVAGSTASAGIASGTATKNS